MEWICKVILVVRKQVNSNADLATKLKTRQTNKNPHTSKTQNTSLHPFLWKRKAARTKHQSRCTTWPWRRLCCFSLALCKVCCYTDLASLYFICLFSLRNLSHPLTYCKFGEMNKLTITCSTLTARAVSRAFSSFQALVCQINSYCCNH